MDVRHGLPRPLLKVSGELDLATAPLLVAMLDHARRRHTPAVCGPRQRSSADLSVDVDLSEVTFADSHGLAPILDSNVTVVRASAGARRVLDLLQEVEPLRRARRGSRTRPSTSTVARRGPGRQHDLSCR